MGVTRRGVFAAALLLGSGVSVLARAATAPAPSSVSTWLGYEERLRARMDDAGGGDFDLDFGRELLTQTNGFRDDAALERYQWHDGLAAVARAHAADMAARGFFAHESPEGFSHLDRVSLLTRDLCAATVENLAWRNDGGRATSPRQFETMWEQSPGHRKNLLRNGYDSAGYGVVRVGTTYYAAGVYASTAVQLANPLPLTLEAGPELTQALQGAQPAIQRMAVTRPFEQPTAMTTPGAGLPDLASGVWQLRPLQASAPGRYNVLPGPMFFVA